MNKTSVMRFITSNYRSYDAGVKNKFIVEWFKEEDESARPWSLWLLKVDEPGELPRHSII